MLKYIVIFTLSILSLGTQAYYPETRLDQEEPEVGARQSLMLDRTKDALLSFEHIEERAEYFVFKLKALTFGDYTEDVMYIAPVITGNVELRAYNMNVYYNHFQSKGGVRYQLKF